MNTMQCPKTPGRAFPAHALTLAITLALTACGGGGGGGDPEDIDAGAGNLRITAANRDTVAAAAAVAVAGGMAQSGTIGLAADRQTALRASTSQARHSLPGAAGIAWVAIQQAVAGLQASGRERRAQLMPPEVMACAHGGTRTLTFDDRDGSGNASLGDTIDVIDAACRDLPDAQSDGRLAITLSSAQVTPTLALVAGARFENYTLASLSSVRRSTFNGDFTLSTTEVDANRSNIEMKVGTNLVTAVTHPNYSDTVTFLSGYTITMATWLSSPFDGDAGQPLQQLSVNGTVRSQAAGGTFLVWQPGAPATPFTLLGDDAYPRAGHAQVQTNFSLMWLTALPSGQARVEADYEANGSVDSLQEVAWESLL